MSFIKFLVMHYVTDDGNDYDNETDKKLPFKSTDAYSVINYVSISNQLISFNYKSLPTISDDFFIEDDSIIFTNCHVLVWHPPQFS
ncbi:MAG: hypothetical protein ABI772_15685 [Bacteroidota bacterium]